MYSEPIQDEEPRDWLSGKPMLLPVGKRARLELPRLPVAATDLIGRDQDVANLVDLLRKPDTRLVTLTGPGGIGKTRLALEVASRLDEEFEHGAGFVPLAHVSDPALIGPAVAAILRIPGAGLASLVESIGASLEGDSTLLVLDNFEQIVESAPFVMNLLAAAPGLKIIVTSRARLRVRAEREYRVRPLRIDPDAATDGASDTRPDAPAVSLFVTRAMEANPHFRVSPARLDQIAKICDRLDGMPLAIELAAARTRVLPPEGLLARLDRTLSFLTGGPRDAPKRQQAMRDTIRWTVDLLSNEDRAAFRRLSVFPGGFTLEAAAFVARLGEPAVDGLDPENDILLSIERLADESLLKTEDLENADQTDIRFSFFETIREYGLELLQEAGEWETVHALLADWCEYAAKRAEPALVEIGVVPQFTMLEREYPNFRETFIWLRDRGHARRGLRVLKSIGWFMTQRFLLEEATRWATTFLEMPDARTDMAEYADGLTESAKIQYWYSEFERSAELHEKALPILRELDDQRGLAVSLRELANTLFDQGQVERARALLYESIAICQEIDSPFLLAHAHVILARLILEDRDFAGSLQLYEEALRTFRAEKQITWIALALDGSAYVHLLQRDARSARAVSLEAMKNAQAIHDYWRLTACTLTMAEVARIDGALEHSARLFGAAWSNRVRLGVRQRPATRVITDGWISELKSSLGDTRFQRLWDEGAGLTREAGVALALSGPGSQVAPAEQPAERPRGDDAIQAAGLTPREIEILRSLKRGDSNQAIADQFFISPRTVMQHVANIFRKIDVPSRTAAAAWAHRNGVE